MSWVSLKKHVTLAMGIVMAMGVILTSSNAWAQNGVADIKAAFDEAMAKPLAERVSLLEELEQKIDQRVFDGTLRGQARSEGLYYKYHTQLQLAKHPDAKRAYVSYIESIKDYSGSGKAYTRYCRILWIDSFSSGDFLNAIHKLNSSNQLLQ
jgi:hypothetical protein